MDRETGPRAAPTGPDGRPVDGPRDIDGEIWDTQPLDIPTVEFQAPPASAQQGATRGSAARRAGQVGPGPSSRPRAADSARQAAGPSARGVGPTAGAGLVFAADPRLLAWIRRVVIALVVALVAGLLLDWRIGVTAAAVAAFIDTVYSSRTMALIPAAARVSSAQRMTRRRLVAARPYGYMAVHARAIPGTESVIDHLVIGPSGVVAIDSERWDRRLPVRTVASNSAAGPVLYHGPFSQKERLAHARWEAAQAARLLSAELGREVEVDPAMVIYGPSIPWRVATLRGVAVFAGGSVGTYLRGRNRTSRGSELSLDQTAEIFEAAERALPSALGRGPALVRRRSHRADG